MSDSLIVMTIHKYYPGWDPPKDTGREWISCLCPFHGDSNKSASVSFKNDAFRCFACPVKGDAIAIIRLQEEVTFAEALRITEELSPGSHRAVPAKHGGKSSRRVFGDPGSSVPQHQARDGQVPPRVRGRPTPWS
ncbi:DNA primase [Mycobacterium phage MyraDee]|uniref:DNA primase n=1 Tax=Mycobacterium phage MyraDee TaxID=2024303 RepID=A0A222YY26_9CAUD|nr:DNA primase [Mycobacterium phage MyraDee]ASR77202.1 DNA primase [Mycobacterium phage MyraDee]